MVISPYRIEYWNVPYEGTTASFGYYTSKISRKSEYFNSLYRHDRKRKKFPTPDMLERIAAALEIDVPVLFSLKSYPVSESGTIAKFQEQVIDDIAQVIAYRAKELEWNTISRPIIPSR